MKVHVRRFIIRAEREWPTLIRIWNEFRAVCKRMIVVALITFLRIVKVSASYFSFGLQWPTATKTVCENQIKSCSGKYFNFVSLSANNPNPRFHFTAQDFSRTLEESHQHGKCFKMISLARLLKTQDESLFLSLFFFLIPFFCLWVRERSDSL